MPLLNGIPYSDLQSPVLSFRHDAVTCRRFYSVDWLDLAEFCFYLRGTTTISPGGSYYARRIPHRFRFQPADSDVGRFEGMTRDFICIDVSEGKGQGLDRKADGRINTTYLQDPNDATHIIDKDEVPVSSRAHVVADYMVAPYAYTEDEYVNDPTVDGNSVTNEWDRFTTWDAEFSTQLLDVPQAAYKYVGVDSNARQIPIPLRIPIISAKITAKVHGLPTIPPAALSYPGCVNDADFTFSLRPIDSGDAQTFTCEKETLLYLSHKTEQGCAADGQQLRDVTYYLDYRSIGQNKQPYYNLAKKRVEFITVAVDPANPTKDGSAPFGLRRFGYLWSPAKPPPPT